MEDLFQFDTYSKSKSMAPAVNSYQRSDCWGIICYSICKLCFVCLK